MKKRIVTALLCAFFSVFLLHAYTPLDRSSINSFDRFFMHPYEKSLDTAATVLDAALVLTPLIPAFSGERTAGTTLVMYAETFLLSWGAKEILKSAFSRQRPYLYYDNPPEDEKDDWEKSFPSGHTAVAFASASFVSYTFCRINPESPWKVPLTAALYSAAAATAALRVMGGSHFLTDVIAGAALGTVFGLAVPALHTLSKKASLSITPFSLIVTLPF